MNAFAYKVKVDRRWDRQSVQVWFYQPSELGPLKVATPGDEPGTWMDVEIDRGEAFPTPSLELPEPLFEAMVAAGSDFFPPSAAAERHLNDALKVRDRLLDLVAPERDRG